jgi:hypothetical protein
VNLVVVVVRESLHVAILFVLLSEHHATREILCEERYECLLKDYDQQENSICHNEQNAMN